MSIQDLLNEDLDALQTKVQILDSRLSVFPPSLLEDCPTIWDHISSLLGCQFEMGVDATTL
jgi:hypothetical protein